jgi:hypothetical protein
MDQSINGIGSTILDGSTNVVYGVGGGASSSSNGSGGNNGAPGIVGVVIFRVPR